jgi:hypothetical protein
MVITRFRLEATGTSASNIQLQLHDAITEIAVLEGTSTDEWEITDSVLSLEKKSQPPKWIGRVVVKRRTDD